MAVPALPGGFEVIATTYGSDDPGGVVRTDVAGGMPRYALDWDRGAQRYTITLMLDAAGFSVWTVFYHRIIKKGAVAFDLPIDSGRGVSPHRANIVPGTYSVSITADALRVVAFTVEAETQVYAMTPAEVAAAVSLYTVAGVPTLPAGLEVVAATYSSDDPGGVVRSDVAGGMPAYALDWDRGAQRYTITLVLSAAEFSVWATFYHHVIKKGAIAFDLPIDSGMGVSLHRANIVPGSYSATTTADALRVVSFTVEAENQAYALADAEVAALIDFYGVAGSDSGELLGRIGRFATVDTLALNF